jgi:hypothetical protein
LPLRIAGKHLDDVIVQAIVKLALKRPRELLVFNFARPEKKLIGMDLDALGLEADFDFDALHPVARGASAEFKQRMLVSDEFALYFLEKFAHWPLIHWRGDAIGTAQ